MDLSTKQKFDEYVKGLFEEIGKPQLAALREENEKKAAEVAGDAVAKAIATFRDEQKAKSDPEKVEKGRLGAMVVRAFAAGRGDLDKAQAWAKQNGFPEEVTKALATSPNSAGGYILPPDYSTDLIGLLYNRTAVRALGAVSVPMPNGTLTVPKLKTGIAASYIGENASDRAQQPSFGVVQFSWKKLRATVPLSNDIIRFSSPKADAVVQNDLTNAFVIAEDATFLRGAGSGVSPKGLDAWIPTANPDHSVPAASADGSDLTLVIADLFRMPKLLEESNIPGIKLGWVISPRTKFFLMQVRDSSGNFYFLEEMRRGTLLGIPFVSTNQVPSNLGGNNDESVIYFGDFNDAVIAEVSDLLLDVSQEAAYIDENGNLVSAFALDQTVIRAIARHDFGVRREESFAKLTGVKWGSV